MNTHIKLLLVVLLLFPILAFGQVAELTKRLQGYKPVWTLERDIYGRTVVRERFPEIATEKVRQIAVSEEVLDAMERTYSGKSSKRVVPEFDFKFVGVTTTLRLQSEVWRYSIDDERLFRLKSSRLVYRYQPKRWPTGFMDLVDKAFARPVKSFVTKRLDF